MIFWLEDEPENIKQDEVLEINEGGYDVNISESLNKFTSDLYIAKNEKIELFIIDIKMLKKYEKKVKCIDGRIIHINDSLESGVLFYKECIAVNYPNVPVLFYTSKQRLQLDREIVKFNLNEEYVFTKIKKFEFLSKIFSILGKKYV